MLGLKLHHAIYRGPRCLKLSLCIKKSNLYGILEPYIGQHIISIEQLHTVAGNNMYTCGVISTQQNPSLNCNMETEHSGPLLTLNGRLRPGQYLRFTTDVKVSLPSGFWNTGMPQLSGVFDSPSAFTIYCPNQQSCESQKHFWNTFSQINYCYFPSNLTWSDEFIKYPISATLNDKDFPPLNSNQWENK